MGRLLVSNPDPPAPRPADSKKSPCDIIKTTLEKEVKDETEPANTPMFQDVPQGQEIDMCKAIPADARIPKLIQGPQGQFFIVDPKPDRESLNKRTRCCCDCCPDSDLEFPLRTFTFCALCMNMVYFFFVLTVSITMAVMSNATPKWSTIPSPAEPDTCQTYDGQHCAFPEPEEVRQTRKQAYKEEAKERWRLRDWMYWLLFFVWCGCFIIVKVFYSRVICQCCGGGDYRTAQQKYVNFKVASIASVARMLIEWLPFTTNPLLILIVIPHWLFRIYCLLAAFQLVPPKPIIVEKAPLVVNVIPSGNAQPGNPQPAEPPPVEEKKEP